ncbi:hypothetical protein ACIRL3_25930 [Streptomyces sp. NPDC102384]|uniref:hypothetical protein n=1 Tax=Streptomyces sp. NPDC102384 TaxID=3366166 RepID=UPI0038054E38
MTQASTLPHLVDRWLPAPLIQVQQDSRVTVHPGNGATGTSRSAAYRPPAATDPGHTHAATATNALAPAAPGVQLGHLDVVAGTLGELADERPRAALTTARIVSGRYHTPSQDLQRRVHELTGGTVAEGLARSVTSGSWVRTPATI